jgi:hypothetical protein
MIFEVPMVRGLQPRELGSKYEIVRIAIQRLAELGQVERIENRVSANGEDLWCLVNAPRVVRLREVG